MFISFVHFGKINPLEYTSIEHVLDTYIESNIQVYENFAYKQMVVSISEIMSMAFLWMKRMRWRQFEYFGYLDSNRWTDRIFDNEFSICYPDNSFDIWQTALSCGLHLEEMIYWILTLSNAWSYFCAEQLVVLYSLCAIQKGNCQSNGDIERTHLSHLHPSINTFEEALNTNGSTVSQV